MQCHMHVEHGGLVCITSCLHAPLPPRTSFSHPEVRDMSPSRYCANSVSTRLRKVQRLRARVNHGGKCHAIDTSVVKPRYKEFYTRQQLRNMTSWLSK